jgi:hypothetical protein
MKTWLTFLSTLLIAMLFAACLGRMALAQTGWLTGGWSYESNIEIYANRGDPATRLLGNANGTQTGRMIEISRINAFGDTGGKLQGLVRDQGQITWNFVYSGGTSGCHKGSTPAEVTLDPNKKKLQIRVPWHSGENCAYNTPFIATLYHN